MIIPTIQAYETKKSRGGKPKLKAGMSANASIASWRPKFHSEEVRSSGPTCKVDIAALPGDILCCMVFDV